jgi:hypothetical protein
LFLQAVLDIEILNIEMVTASRSLTVPQKLSRADKSGLVFVAAHCKDPNYSSQSLMFPAVTSICSCFRRALYTWMGSTAKK